jgi:hypothetical protein
MTRMIWNRWRNLSIRIHRRVFSSPLPNEPFSVRYSSCRRRIFNCSCRCIGCAYPAIRLRARWTNSSIEYFRYVREKWKAEGVRAGLLSTIDDLERRIRGQWFFRSSYSSHSVRNTFLKSLQGLRNLLLRICVPLRPLTSSRKFQKNSKIIFDTLQALYMKINNRIPCSLNKVCFNLDIPEQDELQIRIVGTNTMFFSFLFSRWAEV